jgi:TnpA family transposase
VPFNAILTPANDHESNYVLDILYNNSSDINPDVHTTDTHGSNKANFILLYLFGFKFAPRLKNLKSRTNTLIAFKDMKKYDGLLIRPSKRVNKKLILDQWDNCLRIFASLALKTTTQSTIIRKLCSVDAKNRTKQAIWELNEIVKSTYIYEFINDLKLRQNVQKTLNRGESFNKLTRAISTIGSSKIKFRTEMEQKISLECNRLIANIIIYFNLKLLTHMKKEKISPDQSTYERIMKGTSPVAWRHINLQGRYEFKGTQSINFDEIVGV